MRQQVTLSLFTDFETFTVLKPSDVQVHFLGVLFDEVVAWSNALAPLRSA